MTDLERQKMMANIDFDLMAIEEDEEYLLRKFRRLSDRGKENVIIQLNIALNSDLKHSESKETKKAQAVSHRFTVTDGIDITTKCRELKSSEFEAIVNLITELYRLEPKKKGGHPRYYSTKYQKLSDVAKRKVIDQINAFLNPALESEKNTTMSSKINAGIAVLIDFPNRAPKGKGGTV